MLSTREVNEIADAPAGAVQEAITASQTPKGLEVAKSGTPGTPTALPATSRQPRLSVASVGADGKVSFTPTPSSEVKTK